MSKEMFGGKPKSLIPPKVERTFDGKVWRSGNALVITLPYTTVEKFGIKEGDLLEITIRK